MFLGGCVHEVPGGALNLPQECRRVHMSTFSTLFSMHGIGRLRRREGHRLGKKEFCSAG